VSPASAEVLAHRVLWGAVLAGGIAFGARLWRMLATDGAIAATLVGTLCAAAGWDWALVLIAFFLSGSLWSRVGRVTKEALTGGIVRKGGERDAVQVLANGGVFALCAVGYIAWLRGSSGSGLGAWPASLWHAAGGGALAAATGDTWATEVGTLWGGSPTSILTRKTVKPGTSGGVTPIGTLAGIGGSAGLGALVWALGWGWRAAAAVAGAGIAGMVADSLLGATLQRRRWCERCNEPTERVVHTCDAITRASGGLSWLDNDGVNALSTLAGAGMAVILYGSLL
jgi:uncharacterized protein (TIGR00297 family)